MEMPAAESDLLRSLRVQGRPQPPITAGFRDAARLVPKSESRSKPPRDATPTWVRAIRWFCNILGLLMLLLAVAPQVARCKSSEEVFICAICLFTTLLVPFFGYMMTMAAVPDDQGRIRGKITSPYTRCQEHVGRLICMAVSLMGLYALYLVAMRTGAAGAHRFLWTVAYGMMGVAATVGHTVPWITGCCTRRDGGRDN